MGGTICITEDAFNSVIADIFRCGGFSLKQPHNFETRATNECNKCAVNYEKGFDQIAWCVSIIYHVRSRCTTR